MSAKTNKIHVLLIITALFFKVNTSFAQWYELNSGVTENLLDGCFVSDSVGFIVGYNGKVLKTIDGGNTWIENATLNGYLTSISHIGADTIYIGGSNFYMSVNGGNTWSMVSSPDFWILDLVFFKSGIGFALTPEYDECTWIYGTNYQANFKVYKTLDHGLTWQLHSSSIESRGRFEKVNDSCAFIIGGFHSEVAHCAGPWYNLSRKTVDAGENWYGFIQPIYGNSLISFINEDVGFYIQSSEGLYKTTDGGNSITQMGTNSNSSTIDHFKFVDEQNGYFITKNKILKSAMSLLDWDLDYISFDTLNYFFKSNNQFLFCIGKNGTILRKNITPNLPVDTILRVATNPEKINFGFVPVDTSKLKPLTILNNGTVPVNLNLSSSLDFKIGLTINNLLTNLNLSLNVNEDTVVYVEFNPITDIHYVDSLIIQTSNIHLLTIPLDGFGYYGFRGNIFNDTVICVDTLKISGDVIVKPNTKLIICAGTFVNFMADSKILVEGELIAIGDSLHTIDFSVDDPNIQCYGVIINNLTSGLKSAVLDYCNFNSQFYMYQLKVQNGIVNVNHSNFSKNEMHPAIFVSKQSVDYLTEVTIENSNIFDNLGNGIEVGYFDNFFVNKCSIYNNYKGIRFYTNKDEINIFGNTIFNNKNLGIDGTGKCKIQKNKIYNNAGGIYLSQCEFKIDNNEIYNNKSSSVGGISADVGFPNSYIYQNLIYNNENSQRQLNATNFENSNGGGINLSSSFLHNTAIYIANNIVCNNKTVGLGNNFFAKSYKNGYNLELYNNIFFDVFENENNVYWNSALPTELVNNCINTPFVSTFNQGNIITDPMFVNPSDSIGQMTNLGVVDWSSTSTSKCIDKGYIKYTNLLYNYDFLGKPRVFNAVVDMGAFEYQGFYKPESNEALVVFPNPANYFIYVSVNSNLTTEFTVFDTSLKLILKVSFNDITKIDINTLSKGIYIYQCKFSDGSSKTGKLVKF